MAAITTLPYTPPAQELPSWLSYSTYTVTTGQPPTAFVTETVVSLSLTYYGVSIPLGEGWVYGGLTSPTSTPTPTSSPTPDPVATTPITSSESASLSESISATTSASGTSATVSASRSTTASLQPSLSISSTSAPVTAVPSSPSTSSPSTSSASSSSNRRTLLIAVIVPLTVLLIAAIWVMILLCLRRRRRREATEPDESEAHWWHAPMPAALANLGGHRHTRLAQDEYGARHHPNDSDWDRVSGEFGGGGGSGQPGAATTSTRSTLPPGAAAAYYAVPTHSDGPSSPAIVPNASPRHVQTMSNVGVGRAGHSYMDVGTQRSQVAFINPQLRANETFHPDRQVFPDSYAGENATSTPALVESLPPPPRTPASPPSAGYLQNGWPDETGALLHREGIHSPPPDRPMSFVADSPPTPPSVTGFTHWLSSFANRFSHGESSTSTASPDPPAYGPSAPQRPWYDFGAAARYHPGDPLDEPAPRSLKHQPIGLTITDEAPVDEKAGLKAELLANDTLEDGAPGSHADWEDLRRGGDKRATLGEPIMLSPAPAKSPSSTHFGSHSTRGPSDRSGDSIRSSHASLRHMQQSSASTVSQEPFILTAEEMPVHNGGSATTNSSGRAKRDYPILSATFGGPSTWLMRGSPGHSRTGSRTGSSASRGGSKSSSRAGTLLSRKSQERSGSGSSDHHHPMPEAPPPAYESKSHSNPNVSHLDSVLV